MTFVPRRLAAPASTWEREVDVVVLGSGAAGLAAALAVRPVRRVLIVTKDALDAGSTAWAQGGLAAVLHPHDSVADHVLDTLAAGAGLCDEQVVVELVEEAPTAIRYLMRLGAAFDPSAAGSEPALTREGGHRHDRIVHSGGDRSGAEVQRTLDQSAMAAGAEVLERAFALDLVVGDGPTGADRRRASPWRCSTRHGGVESVGTVTARAVVLATGGYGQVFASTSNPPAVTGDGLALALRAGLAARDVEFVQFHPTVLWRGPDARGQQALVSEAVRGEGAILYDGAGRRVMAGVHPQEDLAPRDVVAAAISRRMAEAPGGVDDHVDLDATNLGERFYDAVPVDHRGVPGDRHRPGDGSHPGRAGRPLRLRRRARPAGRGNGDAGAVRGGRGGVHGRPRRQPARLELAHRERRRRHATRARPGLGVAARPSFRWRPRATGRCSPPSTDGEVRSAMSRFVGVLRDAESLGAAAAALDAVAGKVDTAGRPTRRAWEATNVATVATAVVAAATERTESRGCHRRTDFPEPRPEWVRHLDVVVGSGDEVEVG